MKPIAAVSTVIVALAAAWLLVLHWLPTPYDALWVEGLYQRKEAAAQRIADRKKIVVIGGSAVHLGLSGSVISSETGLPTVNYGTHAGLGAHYLLHRARRVLHTGDIAIVSLEHLMLAKTWKPTYVLANYVNAVDWKYLLHAPIGDVLALVFGTSPIRLLREQLWRVLPDGSKFYKVGTVAENGDETGHGSDLVTRDMRDVVANEKAVGTWQVDRDTRSEAIRDFAAWARATGVMLFFAWAPMIDRQAYHQPDHRAFFSGLDQLYIEAGFTLLGSVHEFLYPPEAMFDTSFHLHAGGARMHSQAVARKLCAHIECAGAR